jgi:hypothetical protein
MRGPSALALALAACGHTAAVTTDASSGDDSDHGVDGTTAADAPAGSDAAGNYRSSLSVCWNDATCPRVFAVAHGGAWDATTTPYDSNAALEAAYADGDDGVKIDVRVTRDNVPVIAHSSPIQAYESLDCANQRIEEMTAAEVTSCHRFPSTTEKFQRLDDVLAYLRGKMVVQLCVKLVGDFGRTIDEVHAQHAEDFAFLEINAGDVEAVEPALPGSSTVYYLVNLASDLAPVDNLLARHDPRLFMFEIDPGVDIGTLVPDTLHPANVRSFIYDSAASPTVAQLATHYAAGFDAVSSQSGPNGVQARIMTNTGRNVTPP